LCSDGYKKDGVVTTFKLDVQKIWKIYLFIFFLFIYYFYCNNIIEINKTKTSKGSVYFLVFEVNSVSREGSKQEDDETDDTIPGTRPAENSSNGALLRGGQLMLN